MSAAASIQIEISSFMVTSIFEGNMDVFSYHLRQREMHSRIFSQHLFPDGEKGILEEAAIYCKAG